MNKQYLGAGIAGLFLFLLVYIPAPLLYGWSGDSWGPQTRVIGISGTLWRGQAALVNLSGIALRKVQWQWRPHALLIGRISHRMQAQTDGGSLDAIISSPLIGNTLRITGLNGSLPVKQFGNSLQVPINPFSGRMHLKLQLLHLREGKPWRVKGSIDFNNLDFNFTSPPTTLGNYHAELSTVKESIQLELNSNGGNLEASGTGQISHEGQYQVELKLRPYASAPATIVNLLQPLGKPTAEGWYLLRQNGAF